VVRQYIMVKAHGRENLFISLQLGSREREEKGPGPNIPFKGMLLPMT
jgi:hypothetical protein